MILFGSVSLLILLFPIHDFLVALGSPNLNGYGGVDYRLFMDAATALASGRPRTSNHYQFAGSYPISAGDILYPAGRSGPVRSIHPPAGVALVARSGRGVGILPNPTAA